MARSALSFLRASCSSTSPEGSSVGCGRTNDRQTGGAVALLRIVIIAAVALAWEMLAASGLLFRDVVPSLGVVGSAVFRLLADEGFYRNLAITLGEIGAALAIGGIAGL